MKRASWRVMVLTLGALFCLAGSLAAAPQFKAVEVVSTNGPPYYAKALNNWGQVVGHSLTPNHLNAHAYLWSAKGGMKDLGTLGNYSEGIAINDQGQVAGDSNTIGNPLHTPCLWSAKGDIKDLGTLGGDYGWAMAINNQGQVIGYSNTTIGGFAPQNCFFWSAKGGIEDLGTLGGSQTAVNAINNLGQVIGYSYLIGDKHLHAYLWTAQVDGGVGGQGQVESGMKDLAGC
jgi:probable HAF family extracellular repeat protein